MTRRLRSAAVIPLALLLAACGPTGASSPPAASPATSNTAGLPSGITPGGHSGYGSGTSTSASTSESTSAATPPPPAPVPGQTPSTPSAGAGAGLTIRGVNSADVTVPATQEWTDTGLDVASWVGISAEGTIDVGGPEGDLAPTGSTTGCVAGPGSFSGQWLADGYPCWSLIARVDDGPPFRVGTGGDFLVSPGRLYLGVDDELSQYGDNSGAWAVALAAAPATAADPGPVPLITWADVGKAMDCASPLEKLKTLGPDGKALYWSITVTLAGKDALDNAQDLLKAALMFGYDVVPVPWSGCFKPIFFPDPAGAGEAIPPTGLTVKADPQDPHSLLLTWTPGAEHVFGYQINNGDTTVTTPGTVSTDPVTFTWTGLSASKYMCFRVRTTTGDSYSDWVPATSPYYVCATSTATP